MIKSLSDINLEELKKNHLDLYYFGLGFIQLKIDKYHRLHFYDPTLPVITNEEEIHNHRYDFESTVLFGQLDNHLYEVDKSKKGFLLSKENCKPDSPDFVKDSEPCSLTYLKSDYHKAGTTYVMNHEWFHKVATPGFAITFLKRSDYKKDLAEVVRPQEIAKICPFSLVLTKEELWTRIEKMLNEAKKRVI